MKATTPTLLLAGGGVALAAPGLSAFRRDMSIFKRWDYDVCLNNCSMAGVPIPDKDTIQLPLENFWSEQCPPIYIGDWSAPTATSRVCLDFIGPNVYFNFSSFPGYTYSNAAVTLKVMGNILTPSSWNPPPPPAPSYTCGPNPGADGFVCVVPFSDILGVPSTTGILDLLSGMCPNADSAAQGFYLQFSGQVTDASSTVFDLHQQYPCTSRDSTGQCTAWNSSIPYTEIAYRCSKCNVAPCPPPPTTTCGFGTAFGYQSADKSVTLNTQSGQGCNRWGWFETPTLADLQAGISGPLLVGAGLNDVTKATTVGTWTATANASGKVTVTYLTNAPFSLAEVHVDLVCLPIAKCAPGSYTFGTTLSDASTFSTPGIQYPACSGGSKAALIVHAAIDEVLQTTTCPAPLAT